VKNLFSPLSDKDLVIPVLGICPLLVAATNSVTAVTMGMVALLSLILISIVVSGLRNIISYDLRITIIIFVSATLVNVIYFCMQTWFYELSLVLGIYIPLIAMNCLVLANAEEYALQNNVLNSFLYSLKVGIGMVFLIIVVGMFREITGYGTVLQQSELLVGDMARSWKMTLLNGDSGLPFFKSAPGAFFVLGLVIALTNFMDTRTEHPTSP
jgi:Predicted NADH:ubiquinone oxidoreductase, subunit RnfE